MHFTIALERSTGPWWEARVPELPGSLGRGDSPEEALAESHRCAERILDLKLEANSTHPTRRAFQVSVLGSAFLAAAACGWGEPEGSPSGSNGDRELSLRIDGKTHHLHLDSRTTLLDALRELLSRSGAKDGCDLGPGAAYTVLVDGKRVLSCLTLALLQEGQDIGSLEGLSWGSLPNPLQADFLKQGALSRGTCRPGPLFAPARLVLRAETPQEVAS